MEIAANGSSQKLVNELENMNSQGGFDISVLTDMQGFPIASATCNGADPQSQAAVVALIQKTFLQVRDQLGMGPFDELTLFDIDGRRLVCRAFNIDNYDLILAILIPDKNQSYRRLTNVTLNALRQQWDV